MKNGRQFVKLKPKMQFVSTGRQQTDESSSVRKWYFGITWNTKQKNMDKF